MYIDPEAALSVLEMASGHFGFRDENIEKTDACALATASLIALGCEYYRALIR